MTSRRSLDLQQEPLEEQRSLIDFVREYRTRHHTVPLRIDDPSGQDMTGCSCPWCEAAPLERAMVLSVLEDENG